MRNREWFWCWNYGVTPKSKKRKACRCNTREGRVYTLGLLTETFPCATLLYYIRSWRRKGYDKKKRYKDRLQDLGEQRRLGMGRQVRTQQALGKKKDVEAKLALLNVTERAVKAQSYSSILDDWLKKTSHYSWPLRGFSDFSDFPCLWLGICLEETNPLSCTPTFSERGC